jgi:hypothetical protein
MDKVRGKKAGPNERPERLRAEGKRKSAGSGEGAESALANLREIERTRFRYEPADDTGPAALDPPAVTAAPVP